MVASVLAAGFVFGLAVAAPVGPVALLCIRRALGRGWASGLASGLGVGTADAAYAAVATTGVGLATFLLGPATRWLQLMGGLAIIAIGIRTLLAAAPAAAAAPADERSGLLRDYASILAITLANPPTILSFAALAAALTPTRAGGPVAVAVLVLGVFLGSSAWWALLTGAAAAVRRRLGPRVLLAITRVSGAALVLFGTAAAVSALR